jgi:hypothetical protein
MSNTGKTLENNHENTLSNEVKTNYETNNSNFWLKIKYAAFEVGINSTSHGKILMNRKIEL